MGLESEVQKHDIGQWLVLSHDEMWPDKQHLQETRNMQAVSLYINLL